MGIDSEKRTQILKRRAFLTGSLKFLALGGVFGRMFYMQAIEGEDFRQRAAKNHMAEIYKAPNRGSIFDRNGNFVAENKYVYQVEIDSLEVKDIRRTLVKLQKLLNLSDKVAKKVLSDYVSQHAYISIVVKTNLSWEEVSAVSLHLYEMRGVKVVERLSRFYPFGEVLGHVVGYVSPATKDEQNKSKDPLLRLPNFPTGKLGVENIFESMLRGKAGYETFVTSAVGHQVNTVQELKPVNGEDIHLTIDAELQSYIYKTLEGKSASVCVMNVKTGEILGLTSTPSYNPNNFVAGISQESWNILSENQLSPLLNKPIMGVYPPGSTFKMVVALAALETGIIDEETSFNCEGLIDVGKTKFHCWKKEGHGELTIMDAIAQSCDVFFYELGKMININKLKVISKSFGLGELTRIKIPFEKSGIVPDSKYKWREFRERWYVGDSIISAIGQGYVSATPLQLALMTAQISNGGYKIHPHLIKKVGGKNIEFSQPELLGYKTENIELVKKAMLNVIVSPKGTAKYTNLGFKDWQMAGKTGTSQVKKITLEERILKESEDYQPKEIPFKERDHALFVAFAPYDDPKFAISIVVEHGGSGSAVAGPVARKIMRYIKKNESRLLQG